MQKETRRNLFTLSYILFALGCAAGALITAIKAENYIYYWIPFIFLVPYLCGKVGPNILRDVEDDVRHNERPGKDIKFLKIKKNANR